MPAPRTQESSGVVLKPMRGPPALAVREPNCSEVRLSLDFHGVVQDYSGRVSAENLAAIEDFIRDSRRNKIGICTILGSADIIVKQEGERWQVLFRIFDPELDWTKGC